MKKYEVIVEDENARMLRDLLQSLPFVKEVKQAGNNTYSLTELGESVSEDEAEKGSLDELFGLWKDRKVSLDKTREQQWGKKTK